MGASPKIKNFFDIVDSRCSFRNETKFSTKNIYTVRYGTETANHIRIFCQMVVKYQQLLKNLRLR